MTTAVQKAITQTVKDKPTRDALDILNQNIQSVNGELPQNNPAWWSFWQKVSQDLGIPLPTTETFILMADWIKWFGLVSSNSGLTTPTVWWTGLNGKITFDRLNNINWYNWFNAGSELYGLMFPGPMTYDSNNKVVFSATVNKQWFTWIEDVTKILGLDSFMPSSAIVGG